MECHPPLSACPRNLFGRSLQLSEARFGEDTVYAQEAEGGKSPAAQMEMPALMGISTGFCFCNCDAAKVCNYLVQKKKLFRLQCLDL